VVDKNEEDKLKKGFYKKKWWLRKRGRKDFIVTF